MRKELPPITPTIAGNPRALAKWLSQAMDNLSGEVDYVQRTVADLPTTETVVTSATDISNETSESAAGAAVTEYSESVGSIRIVDNEAALATLDAKDGDVAFVRGQAGLYKHMLTQPIVSTWEGNPPVLTATPAPAVTGAPNWYRTMDGADLLLHSITASQINVASLSAITADLGTVTAGSITGVTITGSTIRTAPAGNNRIEMLTGGFADKLRWVDAAGDLAAQITGLAAALTISKAIPGSSGPSIQLTNTNVLFNTYGLGDFVFDARLVAQGGLTVNGGSIILDNFSINQSGDLTLGSAGSATGQIVLYDHDNASNPTAAPHTNAVKIYFERRSGSTNRLMMVNNAGTRVQIATF